MKRFPVVALILVLAGCGPRAGTTDDPAKGTSRKVEPWENVAAQLRKETDLATCRTALGQLNNELTERTDLPPVPGLSPEAEKALARLVPLSTTDLGEIRPAAYSALDPAYLAECFYFRDAARSIDPSGIPPRELARLAFAWVCRQVYLQPWEVDPAGYIPAVAPTFTLGRGFGSGLERAYVFLAILQQMGIDGCLIGDASLGTFRTDGRKSIVTRGPFWAVGARIDSDIILFNPWSGEPFPTPDGKGVATLAQIKSNPTQWKLKPDDVSGSSIALAVPLSSLAPRLALLESKIAADTGVKLAVDAEALKKRFPAEAKFWNHPEDRFSYTRLLSAFLPTEEGGLDRSELQHRPHTLYFRSLVPASLTELPAELSPAVAERLQAGIRGVYSSAFFAPPTPRERIQRGQFQDAARDLTQKQQAFVRGLERIRGVAPGELKQWQETANAMHENLTRARYPDPNQTTPLPDSNPDVSDAKAKMEEFWKTTEGISRVLIDRGTASIGRSEATYLLALAKHEEAERRGAGASGADAWKEAANAWNAFLEQDEAAALPARTAHAKTLRSRAKLMLEAK